MNCSMAVFMSRKMPRSEVAICVELMVTVQASSCAHPKPNEQRVMHKRKARLIMQFFNDGLYNVLCYGMFVFQVECLGLVVPVQDGDLVGVVTKAGAVVAQRI